MKSKRIDRRGFVKRSLAAAGAGLAIASLEEQHLLAQATAPTRSAASGPQAGALPHGKIKELQISRLFCGGNLIGGWAHSRDLTYVSSLVKAYHTDEKVFDTLELAEENGINAVLTNPRSDAVINRYWKERGGEIQWISDCAWGKDLKEGIQRSIDGGAHAVYLQGGIADQKVRDGKVDELGEALNFILEQKIPGGLGAHELETIKACVNAGFKPDYWVKTLHPDNYWSATPKENRKPFDVVGPTSRNHGEFNDNMYCRNPQETIDYMTSLKEPWIAFKVMAAGAVRPEEGFRFAFEGGADFVCAGMFDFQVVEDVVIAQQVLGDSGLDQKRPRAWMA